MYRPKVVLSPELTASSAASLGRVVQSPDSDVAWLEPHRYCWVPVATKVTSSDASPQGEEATNVAVASHGSPTWTGAIYGTVPEAEMVGAAAYLLHTPPSACTVHVVDASIIGAHLRRAQEALYCGIKGPTSHLLNQHALSWIVEGLRRLPRRVVGPHHPVVRQSSHLAAVPLETPDSAAARAMAPPAHLVLPKEHAILLVPGDDGELEPRVPSMQALQHVREMEWRSLAARTRAHTPLAGGCEAVPLGAVHHHPTHINMLRARDGRLSTMQVMRRWRQKVTQRTWSRLKKMCMHAGTIGSPRSCSCRCKIEGRRCTRSCEVTHPSACRQGGSNGVRGETRLPASPATCRQPFRGHRCTHCWCHGSTSCTRRPYPCSLTGWRRGAGLQPVDRFPGGTGLPGIQGVVPRGVSAIVGHGAWYHGDRL